jgi:hypothetical protein
VPGGLSLSQRLTGPDGLPTAVARGGAVALAAALAALGYVAGPDGAETPAPAKVTVAASRLAGEWPIASPEPPPALGTVAALPALKERRTRRRAVRRRAPATAVRVPTPAPEPAASTTPAGTATPEPAPVSVTPTREPPPPALAAPPAPRSTPVPTFDLSG